MRFPASPPRANNTSLGTHTPGTGALPLCKRTPRVQILFPCVRRPLTQKQPSCKRTSLVPTRSPHVQKHPKPPQPAPALPGGLPVSPSLPVDPPLPGPSLTHLRRPTPGQHPRVQGGGSWGCGAAAGVAAHDLWGGGGGLGCCLDSSTMGRGWHTGRQPLVPYGLAGAVPASVSPSVPAPAPAPCCKSGFGETDAQASKKSSPSLRQSHHHR